MNGTLIEWTDETWNPVTGCSVVSAGCKHCYAMRLAGGRLKHHPSRAALTVETKAGPVWTGEVRFNTGWLAQPLRWRRPRRIFVCAHGDLFHPAVPDDWIDQVFAVMAVTPHHTYQVLTKRPDRMRHYLAGAARNSYFSHRMAATGAGIFADGDGAQAQLAVDTDWPLPNAWLGTSVEDQDTAEARIPHLLATPAARRFISAEPLLGPINLQSGICDLDWVIVGGESGPDARLMHPDWARALRDQCAAADVPFFFKQWGAWQPTKQWWPGDRRAQVAIDPMGHPVSPQDIGGHRMMLVGKKAAGRLLDGRTHDDMPALLPDYSNGDHQ